MNKHSGSGFTLLEILVALVVFAIFATITSSAMYYAFNARQRLNEQAEQLMALQLAIILIERDTEQVALRAVRGNDMQLFPAFIGRNDYIELTRDGLPNPNSVEKRSTLKRIAYLCDKSRLIRRTWPVLDMPNRDAFQDRILLEGLSQCQFAFLTAKLQMLPEWRAAELPQDKKLEQIPKAIQLLLTVPHRGKASFLFILPEALYANQKS